MYCTAVHRHKPLLLSMRPSVIFLERFTDFPHVVDRHVLSCDVYVKKGKLSTCIKTSTVCCLTIFPRHLW